jgi:hypothetical protein
VAIWRGTHLGSCIIYSSSKSKQKEKKNNYGSFVELVVQQTLDFIPTRLCAKHLSIIDWKTGEH